MNKFDRQTIDAFSALIDDRLFLMLEIMVKFLHYSHPCLRDEATLTIPFYKPQIPLPDWKVSKFSHEK